MSVCRLLFAVLFIKLIFGYNLDVNHAIIIQDPQSEENATSYFGYSLVLIGDNEKWIKVGAPKAKNRQQIESGLVYRCGLLKTCSVEENLNYTSYPLANSWTGGAMDVNYKYNISAISASRWQALAERAPNISGAIFIENVQKQRVETVFSPLIEPQVVAKLPYYARALSGFSLHFPQNGNELLVGAPGVFNYLGTIFRIKNAEKAKNSWRYDVAAPQGNYNEYSGYAITSGRFYNKKELFYVTGLPRGFHRANKKVLAGSVAIFSFTTDRDRCRSENEVLPKVREEIYGSQFGEYFGSVLSSGDINGDGLEDLIVGAPFRFNDRSGFDHGSVYIFYGNKRKLSDNSDRLDGTKSGGHFGLALIVLNDLDNDGLRDLAISAPHEDDCGVVRIYSYDIVTKSIKNTQTISGKEVYRNLRGFGTSLSRPLDMDDNDFADLAIGAPTSGHVVILRSKPTVSITVAIKTPSNISKSNTTFSFQCCYNSTGNKNPTTINRNLTVDQDFNRFHFSGHVRKQNFEEKSIEVSANKETCENITLIKAGSQNYNDPIAIELSFKIPIDQFSLAKNPILIANGTVKDTFCKNCPILNRKSQDRIAKLVIWDHNCLHQGRKEPCRAELEIEAEFFNLNQEKAFVLGSQDHLNLQLSVINKGDPAYSTVVQTFLPRGVDFKSGSVDCQNNDVNIVRCQGEEVINSNEELVYNLTLQVKSDETDQLLQFHFKTSTMTNENYTITKNLTLKLKREVDFLISGSSAESSYVYEPNEPIVMQNIYKIEKYGPSPTSSINVQIQIPHYLKTLENGSEQFLKLMENNDTSTDYSCSKEIDSSEHLENRKSSIDELKIGNIFNLNCHDKNISCILLNCMVGPFQGARKYTEIVLDMEVNFGVLEKLKGKDWLAQINQLIITTGAAISVKNFTQNGNRPDTASIQNVILAYKNVTISLWILIGSVIVGLVILVCFAIGLAKAGFFERKERQMLLMLKEEALEEEKRLEEMIQKELELGHPYEGDPVFRYIKPADLALYWKHLEESATREPLLEDNNETTNNF